MAATPSVKIVKTSPWRGGTRVWSNRYHFNGGTPADTAHWITLFDAVTASEKLVYESDVTITEAIGYAAGSDVPVASKAYSLAGTATYGDSRACPGEVAALIRYTTTARTSKNHPIYLFNYYHDAKSLLGGAADLISTNYRALLTTYAGHWITGFSDGTLTCVRAGPNGATATDKLVEQYLTHRDFPR